MEPINPEPDNRINFLITRDGFVGAQAWALQTARTYRKALLGKGKPGIFVPKKEWKMMYLKAYLEFKRFALVNPRDYYLH